MKQALGYFAKPLVVMLTLTILSMPALMTPTDANAYCEADWTDYGGEDCNTQPYYDPEYYCWKACSDQSMEDECSEQCGTAAVQILASDCNPNGTCACVAECE